MRLLRLAAGTADDDSTPEEEAGALLEADAQHAVMALLDAYARVHAAT